MPKISEIFSSFGYSQEQLPAIGELLYLSNALNEGENKLKFSDSASKDLSAEITQILDTKISHEELNARLQKNLFQKYRTGERQQIEQNTELQTNREKVLDLFDELGFVSKVAPSQENYDYAFIFGATVSGMEGRINTFLKLENGLFMPDSAPKAKEVFILSGARELWLDSPSDHLATEMVLSRIRSAKPDLEITAESIKQECQAIHNANSTKSLATKRDLVVAAFEEKYGIKWPTEADAAQELIDKNYPQLKGRALITNAQKNPDRSRPNTNDTVMQWIKDHPEVKEGSVIAISGQPYIKAQAVPLKLLPGTMSFAMVGPEADRKNQILPELLMTELAGSAFREIHLQQGIQNKASAPKVSTTIQPTASTSLEASRGCTYPAF